MSSIFFFLFLHVQHICEIQQNTAEPTSERIAEDLEGSRSCLTPEMHGGHVARLSPDLSDYLKVDNREDAQFYRMILEARRRFL